MNGSAAAPAAVQDSGAAARPSPRGVSFAEPAREEQQQRAAPTPPSTSGGGSVRFEGTPKKRTSFDLPPEVAAGAGGGDHAGGSGGGGGGGVLDPPAQPAFTGLSRRKQEQLQREQRCGAAARDVHLGTQGCGGKGGRSHEATLPLAESLRAQKAAAHPLSRPPCSATARQRSKYDDLEAGAAVRARRLPGGARVLGVCALPPIRGACVPRPPQNATAAVAAAEPHPPTLLLTQAEAIPDLEEEGREDLSHMVRGGCRVE
jgi:hypothetical protein